MAELPGNRDSFRRILRDRREILERNMPFELSARLIEKGILEPLEQDRLKQIRQSRGLQECQKEFAKILVEKESWTHREVQDLKECLKNLNETYLIEKIYLQSVGRREQIQMADVNPAAGASVVGAGRGRSSNINIVGNQNQVISNSKVTFNTK